MSFALRAFRCGLLRGPSCTYRRGPERVVPPARSSEGGTDEPHGERDLCGEARCMRGRVVNSTNKKKPQQKAQRARRALRGHTGRAPEPGLPTPGTPCLPLRCQWVTSRRRRRRRAQAGLPVLPQRVHPHLQQARCVSHLPRPRSSGKHDRSAMRAKLTSRCTGSSDPRRLLCQPRRVCGRPRHPFSLPCRVWTDCIRGPSAAI